MVLTREELQELHEIVKKALVKLYEMDYSLIERHVNEPALVFRFGIYFNEFVRNSRYFGGFTYLSVDAEYNRNSTVDPEYNFRPGKAKDKKIEGVTRGVYPDLILHKRESNDCNYLILEFKGGWNRVEGQRNNDNHKLEQFTKQDTVAPRNYHYGLGGFIDLHNDRSEICYFKNGAYSSTTAIPFDAHNIP